MKTFKNTFYKIIFLLTAFSCVNKNNDIAPTGSSQKIYEGTWKVSYFEERGKIETSKFKDYLLNFKNDGTLALSNSSIVNNGTWAINSNSDDNSNSSNKLVILISGNDIADQLQDDWIIIEQTSSFIHLQDDNQNHNEILQLSKM